jgi:hypothetical protein
LIARLIYASAVSQPLGADGLTALMEQARLRNKLRGLSGLLAFDSRYFLQMLEGSPRALSDLYGSMARDPRHKSLLLLKYARVDTRLFPDWAMGFVPADAAHLALCARLTGTACFEPFTMDGDRAELLLTDLGAAVAARAGKMLSA